MLERFEIFERFEINFKKSCQDLKLKSSFSDVFYMVTRTFFKATIVFVAYFPCLILAQEAVPGEFIVIYRSYQVSSKTLAKTSLNHNLSLKNSWPQLGTYHFKTRFEGDQQRAMEELKKDPSVLLVEPNYIVKALSLYDGGGPYEGFSTNENENIHMSESWELLSNNQTNDDQTNDDQANDDQTNDDQTNDDQTNDDQTNDDQTNDQTNDQTSDQANDQDTQQDEQDDQGTQQDEQDDQGTQQDDQSGQSYNPIVVAVIDSGLDVEHELFVNSKRLWVNEGEIPGNGIDDDGNGYIDDVNGWNFINNSGDVFDDDAEYGHGTHVAGIVASSAGPLTKATEGSESESLPPIKVMALKFLDKEGVGTTADGISAIYYAIQNGAKVLNNSWGGPFYSRSLHAAVVHTYKNNAIFVAASGNGDSKGNGINTDRLPLYPSALDVPNIISVGASDERDRASFSNYGPNTVHIFAPGVNIYSSRPEYNGNGRKDSYGLLSGTSMAAPYVSALAALMQSEAPNLSGYQIKRDILASASKLKEEYLPTSQSESLIDFKAGILQAQSSAAASESNFKPEYSMKQLESRSIASVDDAVNNNTSQVGCGMVKKLSKDKKAQKNTSIVVFLILWPLLLSWLYRKKTNHSNYFFVDQNLG